MTAVAWWGCAGAATILAKLMRSPDMPVVLSCLSENARAGNSAGCLRPQYGKGRLGPLVEARGQAHTLRAAPMCGERLTAPQRWRGTSRRIPFGVGVLKRAARCGIIADAAGRHRCSELI